MKQFIAFLKKEFYHILRDKRTVMILLVMPILLVILFGFAITNEIQETPIAILDQSRSDAVGQLAVRLDQSEYFEVKKVLYDRASMEQAMRRGEVKMVVIFPPDFPSRLQHEGNSQIALVADASDPNEANMLTGYARNIMMMAFQEGMPDVKASFQIVPDIKLLYNPGMLSAYNFVPGVMGLILILICSMMTSVGIVKEKETGTMEVLLVSPLRPIYIILAKAVPYLLLSVVNVITILLLSYFLLEVPIVGSLWVVALLTMLYIIVSLCLGLLISTVAATQQAAMLVSSMVLLLPVMLLSGMLFPIENMPVVLQWLSHIIPARWFIVAIKDVMIKGLGLTAVWPEVAILSAMAMGLILISVSRFKTRLE